MKPQDQKNLRSLSQWQKVEKITTEESRELVVQAVAGDLKSRDSLILRHVPLVKKVASFYGREFYEDNVQEGIMGLYHALKEFKPELNLTFGNYAKFWVLAYIQRSSRRARKEHNLPTLADLTQPIEASVEEQLIRAELLGYIAEAYQVVEGDLPPRYRQVMELRLMELTPLSVIGKELGVSKQRVEQIEQIVLKKLRSRVNKSLRAKGGR